MKVIRDKHISGQKASLELAELRAKLAEAEETLRAIRAGEVDVVLGHDQQVFKLESADEAYRVLIESMNEGALTLTEDKMILYANQRFASMVKCPLEQVIGGSFRRFISVADRKVLRPLMKSAAKSGAKILVQLHAVNGTQIPVQISISLLPEKKSNHKIIGMVVTDMTVARQTEELLRALNHRVVQAQEVERGRVAMELHDGITQLLCAAIFYSQALVTKLTAQHALPCIVAQAGLRSVTNDAVQIRTQLGETAEEVERVCRNLRPSVLVHLGLAAALRDTGSEFEKRTHIPVKLDCAPELERLPSETELALFRIFQEALRNVEKHSRAKKIHVSLKKKRNILRLIIKDDGLGFNSDQQLARPKRKGGLGLISMKERAAFAGGSLTIKSARSVGKRNGGTEIEIAITLPGTPQRRDPGLIGSIG